MMESSQKVDRRVCNLALKREMGGCFGVTLAVGSGCEKTEVPRRSVLLIGC